MKLCRWYHLTHQITVKNGSKKKSTNVQESQISKEIIEEIEDKPLEMEQEASSLDWNSLIDQIDEGGSDGKA